MARIFCPVCGEERTAQVATQQRCPGSQEQVRTYHCEICGSLVRTEPLR